MGRMRAFIRSGDETANLNAKRRRLIRRRRCHRLAIDGLSRLSSSTILWFRRDAYFVASAGRIYALVNNIFGGPELITLCKLPVLNRIAFLKQCFDAGRHF